MACAQACMGDKTRRQAPPSGGKPLHTPHEHCALSPQGGTLECTWTTVLHRADALLMWMLCQASLRLGASCIASLHIESLLTCMRKLVRLHSSASALLPPHICMLQCCPVHVMHRVYGGNNVARMHRARYTEALGKVCQRQPYVLRRGCGAFVPSAHGSGSSCRRCTASQMPQQMVTTPSPGAMHWVRQVASL